jgi:hypothetical protein
MAEIASDSGAVAADRRDELALLRRLGYSGHAFGCRIAKHQVMS